MAYIYNHIRLDKNEIFYIGIGKNDNDNYSRAYNKNRRSRLWKNIIKSTEYKVEIIIDNISWKEACIRESELIKIYGKIVDGTGTLANLTSGGDGGDTTKNKICIYKDNNEKRIYNNELDLYIKQGWTKGFSPKHREKSSIVKTGKKYSDESNKKKGRPGRIHLEQTKLKISQGNKGKKKPTIECPHCKLNGAASPMIRWHFNNCKYKKISYDTKKEN